MLLRIKDHITQLAWFPQCELYLATNRNHLRITNTSQCMNGIQDVIIDLHSHLRLD